MFMPFALIPAILVVLSLLVSSPVVAQSREDAVRLYKEAYALEATGRSKEDLKKAAQKYEEALEIYLKMGNSENAGQCMRGLGIIHWRWGQYKKAVEYYETWLENARKIGDLKSEVAALGNIGVVYADSGQYEKAAEYYEKALGIARKIGDLKAENAVLNNLGVVHRDWGQNKKAVEYYEKSLEIAKKIGDTKGEGQTLGNLGNVYMGRGQYAKAVQYFEKDLEIAKKTGDLTGEGAVLTSLGTVYSKWGQYQKAVQHYEKALEIDRKMGNTHGEGTVLTNLGNVYMEWGQYAKGVQYYEKRLEIAKKIGDMKGEGHALNNLGRVYGTLGEADKALAHFEKGLAIFQKVGVPDTWPKNLLAGLLLDQGALDKAEPWIKQAGYNSTWGRYYLLKADYNTALVQYAKILKSAKQSRNANLLFTAYTGLGVSCEGLGENALAAEEFEEAIRLTEEIRSSLSPNQRETFFDVKIEGFYRTAPYEGLARVMIKLNRPLDASKWSEYTKARLFAESVSRRSEVGTVGVPADVLKKDEELNNQLGALKKSRQTAYEKNDKEQTAALEPQVKQLEDQFAAHKKMLREKYPLIAATKYPETMDLSQSALKPDEWVLAYDVTDPGLIIYLTRGKELKKALFKPISRKDVDALVRTFRQAFEDVTGDNMAQKLRAFDFAAGKQLADLLLSDVLPEIPKGEALIIVPDDSLGAVPFEMLVLNQGGVIAENKGRPNTTGAEFFGDRNPVSYYQSITALTLARNFGKQKGQEAKRLVMSDPIFDAQDQRLKDLATQKKQNLMKELPQQLMSIKQENKLEFRRLPATADLGKALKEMDPTHTELCMGFDASKPALFKKPLDTYGSVVFATHGYFGKELAGIQEPVLVLTQVDQPKGQDGFLRLSEVMGLKLNADVVALTACQTGLGRQISGEGTMGMGRAFQYAGAKSVLMSLWSVSESASVKLVENFFRNLKQGKSKLEALKLARDEIRKDGFDHPFYWAPFIIVGEVN